MSIWPRWSLEGEPAALAKYVLPDDVAALVHLPGPPASSRIAQTRAVYDALADAGITYSHEAPSDEPDRQVIREPGEVLWSPKHATCLDLALIMAGACLHAGLHPLVFILDPSEAGRAAHALLGVWIGDPRPDGPQMPQTAVWDTAPEGWLDLVQQDVNRPPRPLLLLDPIGIAHPLPTSPIRGARAPFDDAVRAGAEYAAGWDWRLAVDIGRSWRQQDTHTPAGHPKDQPLRPPYVELDPQVHRPLEILKAEHAVVPFQARDELTVLTHFCRTIAAGQHTGIALVHGVGGAGKTRLALELAERMATREGWYTGYLREGSEGRDWLGAVVSPTLIVLDYAEARAADAQDLLAILKRRVERGAVPAVVVMTARSAAGQWLTTLRKAWQRDGHLCRELPSLVLPSEHPDGSAIFRRAVEAFREEPEFVDLSAAERATPEEWTTLDYILLAFLAARSPGRLPETREQLYEEVLEHERGYWAQTYQRVTGSTGDAPVDVLNRAVACLTLRAPITRAQSIATLRAVEELADDAQWRETIRTTLTTCLQPGPGEPLVLRPDPIADQLTLHELDADPELLNRALDGLDPEPLLGALRQLNRAAAAAPDTAADMVATWISGAPDRWRPMLHIAAEQRGTALTALHQLIDTTPAPPWLEEFSQTIPFTTLGLPQLGLHADTRRLTALRSAAHSAPADLAQLLQRLSHRQSNTGDRDAALASITEAVEIHRELAQANPAAYLPNLTGSLNNLSNHQSHTGDREGALASITEAVEIRRALAQANPAAYLPNLTASLNNLSNHQSHTGDREGALASITEAVEIHRELAQANPAAYLPNLTGSLNNLSNHQSHTGDREGALASITEAVEIRRALAQANPAAYLPNLAMSLNNLSNQQSNTTMASAVWENAITALEAHPLAQAELRAHCADYFAEQVGPDRALDQLVSAALTAAAGSPQSLRRARHRIRSVAISHDIDDPRLPDWAIHPLPDDSLELLDQWAQASDWPAAEAFLRAHVDRLQQSDFRHHLQLAAALFPGAQAIDHLTAVLAEADGQGFGTVLQQHRRDHNQRLLLEAWITTPTWPDSKAFLDENSTALHAPEIRALIADMDAPVAHQHLAILQLTDHLRHDTVYEIVTDQDTASEYAFHAMDQADVPQLRQILYAHPGLLTGITGALFATVITMADGDTDQARQLAELIAGHATDVQRRAYAIRLRALALHNRELAPAEELANLIDPGDNS